MRITGITTYPLELTLEEPFAIANETVETAVNVFIRLQTDRGLEAWGCATPDTVTSETGETVVQTVDGPIRELLLGEDPLMIHRLNEQIEAAVPENQSAKAGINLALYDLLGRAADLPLYRLLGGYRGRIETSVTVGINPVDAMVERARDIVARGFRCLKVKCGMDPDHDIEAVMAIRAAVGPEVKLRLDANEGYTVERALRVATTLEDLGADLEILEQPTRGDYLYALKEVTSRCTVPIMADETVLTLRDSLKAVRLELADMINIKLMKIGGITNAAKANLFADLAGIPVMVGCMNESMGAMAAGVHFACAHRNVQYADLDSAPDFVDDVVTGGARYEGGYVIPAEAPGLGITVNL